MMVSCAGVIFHYIFVFLCQCTDSDGCAVDRARAWCEMADINYHRSVVI